MDLDGAAGDEHPLANLRICQSLRDELHHPQLGWGEAFPASLGALALPSSAVRPSNRVLERELAPLGVRLGSELGLQPLPQLVELGLLVLPPRAAVEVLECAVAGAKQAQSFLV
jgi:hypothetical protein